MFALKRWFTLALCAVGKHGSAVEHQAYSVVSRFGNGYWQFVSCECLICGHLWMEQLGYTEFELKGFPLPEVRAQR